MSSTRREDLRKLPELWGATEIAEYSGYSRQWANTLVNDYRFPRPAYTLAMGRIWLADEVRAFLRERQGVDEE